MESCQEIRVPGPMPRRGPPYTTGGTSYFSRGVRWRNKRQIATRQPNKQLSLKILQWNAEGILKKKDALLNRLSEHKIDIACIQETHLSEKYRFTTRGYQCMRMDKAEGPKGGIIILVRNNIQAVEITKGTNRNAEIHSIRLVLESRELPIYNCYCPPDKQLSLEVIDVHSW